MTNPGDNLSLLPSSLAGQAVLLIGGDAHKKYFHDHNARREHTQILSRIQSYANVYFSHDAHAADVIDFARVPANLLPADIG
jgi:hypothetical protein